ncbi:MAG TPA: hypothetical protein VMF32_26450 [Xanthobacteraceae bacterium]|nr:hypothetical protein [Xanthobacteraceae bacterium]
MNTKKGTKTGQRPVVRNTQLFQAQNRASNTSEQRPSELIDALYNPDRQTVVALILVVVLLMLNFILRFPDLGAIIAEYNQF